VDGLRGVLLGAGASDFSVLLNFIVISAISVGMVSVGSYLSERTEVER
jgi:hypothetical protein